MIIRGNTVTTTRKETSSLPLTGGKMEGSVDMNLNELTNIRTPVNERDAVNKQFVEDKASDFKKEANKYTDEKISANKTSKKNATLMASGWSASAPFTQTITVESLSDEKNAIAYPDVPDDAEQEAAMAEETVKVTSCKRSGNQMTFRCREEKPSIDIPVIVEVYT